jgi:hypothetical protein
MTFDRVRNSVHRRTVLCGGGGAVFGMIVTALIGGNKPAKAAAISGPVPEVDQLLVRSVVDSYQIAVAPSSKVDNVEIQRFGWALSDQPPSRAIASEFGLSMHVESRRGSDVRNVLVDFGTARARSGRRSRSMSAARSASVRASGRRRRCKEISERSTAGRSKTPMSP